VAKTVKRTATGVKKTQTVRERSLTSANAAPKKRHVRNTATKASVPFKLVGQGLKIIAKPFSFILRPFKSRPARFTGRVLANVLLINYFRSSWVELKQVVWPNRKETTRLTFAVLMFAIVFGTIVALVDFGLDKLFHKILLK
jgi:preprotein translocase SecE subunit